MGETDLPHEVYAEIERAIAAVDAEAARVGVDWDSFDAEILAKLSTPLEEAAEQEGPVLGLDVYAMLATLRELRDGAGTAAFLAALGLSSGSEPPTR